jgi:hypothetical protein
MGTEYYIAIDGKNGNSGSLALDIGNSPVNDAFADAIALGALPLSVNGATNDGATKEPNEDDHAGNVGGASIWYTWTAAVTGTVAVQTCASAFDTVLAVYTGASVGTLTPVASDDDSCGQQSKLTFAATNGVTYHIAVDGDFQLGQGASGNVELDMALLPPNDDFADAEVLTGLPASTTGWTIGATEETGEPDAVDGYAGVTSVWYSWTAPTSGPVTIDLCDSDFDTTLGVYTGTVVNALTKIASDNDGCGEYAGSILGFQAVSGTTYRIVVDNGGAPGNIDLELYAGVPPPTTTTTTTTTFPGVTTTTQPGSDVTPPETSIDLGPNAKGKKRKVTFAFSADEAGCTFECKLDTKPFEACTSPYQKKVKFGKRVFQVRATDLAGNTDPTPAELRFKVKRPR